MKLSRANYRKGIVYVRTVFGTFFEVINEAYLEDGYGRPICASHFK